MPANFSAPFDLAEVEAAIADTSFAGQIHHVVSTASTNTLAIAAAQAGVASGVWVADEQTAGRGRGGHSWHSAAGDGLYVSILIRPRLSGADALKLSLALGIASIAAIDIATAACLCLRWPNDILDGHPTGKKVGGLLTETAMEPNGHLQYAVIGIGINLNQQIMPDHLQATATSLRISWDESCAVRREVLLPPLLEQVAFEVGQLESEVDQLIAPEDSVIGRFEYCSPMTRNLRVNVDEDGGYTGITEGLEPSGLLRIRLDDGRLRIVRHGGVRPA